MKTILLILLLIPCILHAQVDSTRVDSTKKDSVKYMKAAIVKGRKDYRAQMEKEYSTNGVFSEEAMEYYDLKNDTLYDIPIDWWINNNTNTLRVDLQTGRITYIFNKLKPIHFFVDEMEIAEDNLGLYRSTDIGFIKVLESDFISTQKISPKFSNVGPDTNGFKVPIQEMSLNVIMYTKMWAIRNRPKKLILTQEELSKITTWAELDSIIHQARK